MKKIVLISCVAMKRPHKSPAKDLYISPLFKGNLQYARSLKPDAIYILSAKYGLLELDELIEPYNVTLNNMGVAESRAWAVRVLEQLREKADLQNDHFIFLAGDKYRRHLVPHLASYEIPMEGLTIGKQLQFLASKTK
jgi:hypothetical protein